MNKSVTQTTRNYGAAARAVRGLLFGLLLTLFGSAALAQEAGMDEPAIQVGEETVLTAEEFDEEFNRAIRILAMRQGIPFDEQTRAMFEQFRADFAQQLAAREAALLAAEAEGITVGAEDVDERIQEAIEALGGVEAFEQTLTELGYDSVDVYREEVEEALVVETLLANLRSELDATITDQGIEGFFERNRDMFGDADQFDALGADELEELRGGFADELLQQEVVALMEEYGVELNPDLFQIAPFEADEP